MAFDKKPRPKKKPAGKRPKKQTGLTTDAAASPPPFAPYVPPASSPDKGFVPYSRKGKTSALGIRFDPEREFLRTFKELTYRHRAWDIWNDFVVMAACALSNPVDKVHYEKRETRYLRIINKYNKEEQGKFPILFAHLVMALELNPDQDFLGKVYTNLGLQDNGRRQHFTPYSISELMASVTTNDIVKQVNESGYVTINDPCCGAGSTLIAAVHTAKQNLGKIGINFQNHILVAGQDIDETVALMCYIQLSLLGVAAYIKVGNTLTDPMNSNDALKNYWFTPMFFSDVWAMRRLFRKLDDLLQPSNARISDKKPFKLRIRLKEEDCHCALEQFYEKIAKKAGLRLTSSSRFNPAKIHCSQPVRNVMFDFYSEVTKGDDLGAAMLLASSGPKADIPGNDLAVEIEDGFVTEEAG